MDFNYNKLIGKIIEVCGSRKEYAKQMNFSNQTTTAKLNGDVEFRQSEILKSCEILGIDIKDVKEYFFTV